MKTLEDFRSRRILPLLPQVFCAAATGLGLIGLFGWLSGHPLLAGFGANRIPMAPSTALLFVLLGLSVFFRSRFPLNRGILFVGIALGSLSAAAALLLFYLSSAYIYSSIELLGIPITGTLDGVPIGHMSPVTALLCALIALSFLGTLSSSRERRGGAVAAFVLACILTLMSTALVIAYLLGTPLMYGGAFIPPTLPSSLCSLFLALALLTLAGLQVWPSSFTDETGPSRPLRASLLIFVLLSAGILVFGYVYHRQFERLYKTEVETTLASISDLKVSELRHWREERLGDATVFYGSITFADLAGRFLRTPEAVDARMAILTWFRQESEAYQYDRLSLYDTALVERLSYPGGLEMTDSLFLRHAAVALHSHEIVFQDFYRDEHTHRVYLNILVPILEFRETGRVIGMVAMRIDPRRYIYPLLKRWPTLSRTAETLLIRRDGQTALFLNELKSNSDAALKLRVPLDSTDVSALKAAFGRVGIVEGRDYRGVSVIADVRAVPGSPWYLIARVDLSEVYTPLNERLWIIVFLVCAMLLGVGLGVGMVSRQQKARFYRNRYLADRERAWLHDVIARSLNEIYVCDPGTLRFKFANAGAQRNIGYSMQELAGLTALDITPEFTEQSFRASVQPLHTGGDKVLVSETVHRRKDGTRYPVEFHLQLVERPEGAVLLAIVKDITERKRAEEALQASQEIVAGILDAMPIRVFWKDMNLVYLGCNAAFAADAGFVLPKEIIGKDDYQLGWRDQAERYRKDDRLVIESGSPRLLIEEPQTTPQGATITLLTSKIPLRDSTGAVRGMLGTYMDITARKRAEEAQRESARRFHELFDYAPVGYHEVDDQGRIVEVNRTELDMLGYTAEEMLGHPAWEFIVEREVSREAIAAKIAGSMRSDREYERTFRRKDGTTLKVLIKDRALRNKAGEVVGIRSTVQDITERKKAEQELKLMAQTIASARDCISITDLENKFIFANEAFQTTYGYTTGDLLGKDVSILRSPLAPVAMTDQILDNTLAGGWHGEILNRRKDGSDFPVELWTSVVRDNAGTPVAMVGVSRDITARRVAEERLRQSEEHFRLIAENVADMIAVVDVEGRRIYNSPAYRSILGDPELLKATDGFREIHPDDVAKVREAFQETVRTGIGQRIEYRFLLKDGSVRDIDSKGSVIRGEGGMISQIILVSRDVTEEKKLAAQYLRAQRMESIGTLAGGIAHDLNNVLAPIMMAIEVLRDKISDPGGEKILNVIEISAKRGADIVRQVLAFGRGVKGDRILVQLKHVITEVAKIASATFTKSIDVKTDIPRDLWTVSADPTQMHQVLLNMLVNARDAMPKGGTLSISAENVTLDENYSRMHLEAKPGAYVSIAITDTGTGIPSDIQGKIFEPFFTTKEVGVGTGLGLSTTLGIVKSHEGFINLYSEEGKGTTFRIYIPAAGTASSISAASEEADLPMGNGELILVIDDEAAIREITKETLKANGYKAMTARDGAEGVALFAENKERIKVVITDIMMPVMDGTAAILVLKKINPDVKIIAASGLISRGQIASPSDSNVQAFLTKPYTAEKLLKALATALR